jgi:hypothetical protein
MTAGNARSVAAHTADIAPVTSRVESRVVLPFGHRSGPLMRQAPGLALSRWRVGPGGLGSARLPTGDWCRGLTDASAAQWAQQSLHVAKHFRRGWTLARISLVPRSSGQEHRAGSWCAEFAGAGAGMTQASPSSAGSCRPSAGGNSLPDPASHQPDAHWDARLWGALVVLCSVLFLDGIDVSMVTVALPPIKADLHLSTSQLQWVVSGYVLGYGGLLLLGGRTADLLGRRRTLLVALSVFLVASAFGAVVSDGTLLLIARFLKGASAAFTAPATCRSSPRRSVRDRPAIGRSRSTRRPAPAATRSAWCSAVC